MKKEDKIYSVIGHLFFIFMMFAGILMVISK